MATGALRGIHVFWWISGFFAVTVALDTLFIVWAVQSFPGEQVKNSYVLGLDYNRAVERRAAQKELGWTAELGVREEAGQVLIVRIRDAATQPIANLVVTASVHVAGQSRVDILDLVERMPGEYAVAVELAAQTHIEIDATARRAGSDATVFETTKSLVVP